jgi:NADPH-dependent 2,4-dienoyl-CoA reductase/sulfur reductase-like enzyme
MSNAYRLPGNAGRVDRSKPLTFTYDGKTYQGYQGDTLASALLANGVKLVGRSFKYHRPRGIMTAGSEEPNALVQLGEGAYTEPNTRATMVELYDGLSAASQNCWPSVKFDIQSVNQWFARYLPAGFYYKTFMWPGSWWEPVYEKVIRKAAGLGKSPTENDPDTYAQKFAHCDVLVVGGGPAGLSAALAAGKAGARVILADEQNELGGFLLSDTAEIDGKPAADWVAATAAELAGMESVTVLGRTTVTGYFDYNYLTAAERITDHLGPQENKNTPRQRFWKIRAKRVVLAQGSIDRPLVFADNDRPGIMLASGVRTYINRFGVLPGREVVVFTNNDSAYETALDAKAGGAVVEVVDLRSDPQGPLVAKAEAAGIRIHKGFAIVGTWGKHALSGCEIAPLSEDGKSLIGGTTAVGCDLIAHSGGWNPTVHLFSQARGKLKWDADKHCFVPGFANAWRPISAGAGNGTFDLGGCLAEGLAAGALAAKEAGHGNGAAPDAPATATVQYGPIRAQWLVPGKQPIGRGKAKFFHDHQNDVTAADIHLGRARGLRLGRAFEALHHDRHGHRPGQDVQRQRAGDHGGDPQRPDPRGRHHDLPPALHAVDLRHRRRAEPGRVVPAEAHDADAPRPCRKRRGVRGCRRLEAPLVLPEGRRGHGRGGDARMPAGPRDLRPAGRVDPGQDRHSGQGRRRVPEHDLHQQMGHAEARPRPLRPDAERARHGLRRRRHDPSGRRSFPHDDDDGRRRAGAWLARGMGPDRMARHGRPIRLGHRAMGGLHDHRAERPGAAVGPHAVESGRRRLPLHGHEGRHGGRRSGAGLPDQLHRRPRL